MNARLKTLKYIISDYLTAIISWSLFYFFRKIYISPGSWHDYHFEYDPKFFLGIILIPIFWLLLYYASGYYNDIYRKSRFNELGQTLLVTLIGVLFIFFTSILDDEIVTYKHYYLSFSVLFCIHFMITYIPRLIFTTNTNRNIQKGKISFNTLIIGSNKNAYDAYQEIQNQNKTTGNKFIGFITVNGNGKANPEIEKHIPKLGQLNNIEQIIKDKNVEEVIIAIESSEHEKIGEIISKLDIYNVMIKIIPDMYDILTGSVKMSSIYGTPLIQISNEPLPKWQKSIKQFMDIFGALLALILLSPLCIFIIVCIKLTSKGPIIYSHERIGKNGKPFNIYKFRSMYKNAEKNGPELASKNDCRMTPFGRFMRKLRLDEIPNLFNVLKGDMSLVGPRPERKYFIDQIVKITPQYLHLHKVKPGVTSLGQVKYGYAENVDQMIKRLRYDLLYIENMSIFLDLKIIVYTLLTIIRGHGI